MTTAELCPRCGQPGRTESGRFWHSDGWWTRCADQPAAVLVVDGVVIADIGRRDKP